MENLSSMEINLLDQLPELIWCSDSSAKNIYFNESWLQFTSLSLEQSKGDGWMQSIHPDDLATCLKAYQTAFKHRRNFQSEYRLRRYDGEYRWVLNNAKPYFDSMGNFCGFLGSTTDITERKVAEEKVKEREARVNLLFNHVNDLIILMSVDAQGQPGRVIHVNEVVCTTFGYSEAELLNCKPSILFAPGEESKFPELEAQFRQNAQLTFEFNGITRWGKIIPFEASSHLFALDNQLVAFTIARDISRRKLAEEVLRQTNEKMQGIIQASPLAIITLDTDGVVQSWNPAAERTFGWKEAEAVGQFNPIIPKDHFAEFSNFMQFVKKGNYFPGVELTRQRKDGATLQVRLFTALLHDPKGNVAGYMAIIEDITQLKIFQKRFEEEKSKTEHAMQLASFGALAAGIAHEINQPLNALKIHTDSLLYWYQKGHYPSQEALLTKLKKISKQADRINDVVTYMRLMRAKNEPVKLTKVNINLAVEEALDLLQERLLTNQIKLNLNLASSLPDILGQPSSLQQIVLNLLQNATEALAFLPKASKQISCTTYLQDHYVVLQITDNGPGIPNQLKDSIFDPMFTTKETGLGLGLYIVQTLVINLNGYISVQNNSEQGTTFKIKFPLAR